MDTFLLLKAETAEDDVLEWDMYTIRFLLEVLLLIEDEIEIARISPVPFHASTSMMTDEQWLGQFRIPRDDLERLRLGLGIPFTMVGPVRLRWRGDDGLCILLRRLAYPSELSDLAEIFGRPRSVISIIFNCTAEFVYNRWGFLLRDMNEATWI